MASSIQGSNQLLVIFLLSLSAYAFYATWGISLLDGTLQHMLDHRGADVPLIPGTQEPLRLHFIGIPPIDYWYTIMVLFFWQAVDGSHPSTSLTGIYFLGQLIGIWTLVYIEGYRIGNEGRTIARTLFWAILMQNLTLACFGPIYFVYHLTSSPTNTRHTQQTLLTAARNLKLLPASVLIGYILPSIWIAIPSPVAQSYASQQAAIAVWTPFPVWVSLAHTILTIGEVTLFNSASEKIVARSSPAESRDIYNSALRAVYLFAIAGCAIVHIGTVATSLSALLFPTIFGAGYTEYFAPNTLLFPQNSSSVASIGAGVLNFMQWDQWIGYTAVLSWVLKSYWSEAPKSAALFHTVLEAIVAIALLGPGGAAVLFVWRRDEIMWAEEVVEKSPNFKTG
ncbi:hypothetical protein BJX63DRAFT_437922 [Aspergillus granulosus]|uniref:Uncharacterized protein n=1 Tax=Aspergillus granulosus TaxID=176169 RepID=A0ABR4GTZ3_9EURO